MAANKAVRSLPAKIEERNEKMKAEMIDNLKKLGIQLTVSEIRAQI